MDIYKKIKNATILDTQVDNIFDTHKEWIYGDKKLIKYLADENDNSYGNRNGGFMYPIENGFIASGRDILGHSQDSTYSIIKYDDRFYLFNGKNKMIKFPKKASYHGITDKNNVSEYEHLTDIISVGDKVFVNRGHIVEANGVKYSISGGGNSYTYGYAFIDNDNVLFLGSYWNNYPKKIIFEERLTKKEFFSLDVISMDLEFIGKYY